MCLLDCLKTYSPKSLLWVFLGGSEGVLVILVSVVTLVVTLVVALAVRLLALVFSAAVLCRCTLLQKTAQVWRMLSILTSLSCWYLLLRVCKLFSSSILLVAFSMKLSPNRVALFFPLSSSTGTSLITGLSWDQAIYLLSCVMELETFATRHNTLWTRRITFSLLILDNVSNRFAHKQVGDLLSLELGPAACKESSPTQSGWWEAWSRCEGKRHGKHWPSTTRRLPNKGGVGKRHRSFVGPWILRSEL